MNVKIKDIPLYDRPRERLINLGVQVLSNEELIAILLRSGTNQISVKELSNMILKEIEKISLLSEMTYEKLTSIKGIGQAKACQILAAMELGKRIHQKFDTIKEIKVMNASTIFEYYQEKFKNIKQEHFYCIYLSIKNKIIKDKLLFVGTINESIVHPREIFKEAYLCSAASFICIHNHPSGSVNPSHNDIILTKQLQKAGLELGIPLLDHIIIGKDKYYSFNENGML